MLTLLNPVAADGPWQGPAEVQFPVEFAGDPYDPAQNDCRVSFLPDVGTRAEERLAWYDGAGSWRATLVAKKPGPYRAQFIRNGKKVGDPQTVTLTGPLPRGFVARSAVSNRLAVDGQPVWPTGFNLAWQSPGVPPLTESLGKMGAAGLDWARIWANHWDGKNPLWNPPKGLSLDPAALDKWGSLFDAAEAANVRIQLCLFHHGLVSTTVNSNWGESPWNAANGGFLKTPVTWFADPEAIRRQRIWMRYAVARWSSSPALFGYELFNEVEWADATKEARPSVARWHTESAAYIRSLDPYGRLVLSSSSPDLNADFFATMDTWQPHVYAGDLTAGVTNATRREPGLVGEFGESGGTGGGSLEALRDGTIASILGNHAGSAMWWSWEDVEKKNLYPWFATLTRVIRETGFADRSAAVRLNPVYDRGRGGLLRAAPGGGWGNQPKMPITPDGIGSLSGFLQGTNHREMGSEIVIDVVLPAAATVKVRVDVAAKAGAGVDVLVDGMVKTSASYPAAAADVPVNKDLVVKLPAGKSRLTLRNTGADWVRLGVIEIPGVAPALTVRGIGMPDWALLQVEGQMGGERTIGGLPLPDGARRVRIYPYVGEPIDGATTIVRGVARLDVPSGGALVWIRP